VEALHNDACCPSVCSSLCHLKRIRENDAFSKSKQFRAMVSNRKSYMGFSKNPFLDPLDDLEQQQTSPHDPQQTAV